MVVSKKIKKNPPSKVEKVPNLTVGLHLLTKLTNPYYGQQKKC